MILKYLRHGPVITGGSYYERFLLDKISKLYGNFYIEESNNKTFSGIQAISLLIWSFKKSNGMVNFCVGRCALGSLIRNLFNKKKTIIILHNFDKNDGKSWIAEKYFQLLFNFLKLYNPKKYTLIVVSEYFLNYFRSNLKIKNVIKFPNLFDYRNFEFPNTTLRQESKYIMMGQLSNKYSSDQFEVAGKLELLGYIPIFCQLNGQTVPDNFPFNVFRGQYEDYLKILSICLFQLSLSKFLEGWPRMVHEAALLNVPTIGFEKGGLGDLLRESGGFIIKELSEIRNIFKEQNLLLWKAPREFIERYDVQNCNFYLEPILKFMNE